MIAVINTIDQYIDDDIAVIMSNIVIKNNLGKITIIDDWVDIISGVEEAETLSFNNLNQGIGFAFTEVEVLNQTGVINRIDNRDAITGRFSVDFNVQNQIGTVHRHINIVVYHVVIEDNLCEVSIVNDDITTTCSANEVTLLY